ncbi:hypothetical protein chiPu_0028961, partial [Chiloscyllium punctatum]|nr:hypothetical protein [Chiloscyllium punctatum]
MRSAHSTTPGWRSSRAYRHSVYSARRNATRSQPVSGVLRRWTWGDNVFGTMCAMPEDLASAPAFDAFTLRDLSVCGYYEPTNAAVISLYLCFPPAPTTPPRPRLPRYCRAPLWDRGPQGDWYCGMRERPFMTTSNTKSYLCCSIYRASGYRTIAQH